MPSAFLTGGGSWIEISASVSAAKLASMSESTPLLLRLARGCFFGLGAAAALDFGAAFVVALAAVLGAALVAFLGAGEGSKVSESATETSYASESESILLALGDVAAKRLGRVEERRVRVREGGSGDGEVAGKRRRAEVLEDGWPNRLKGEAVRQSCDVPPQRRYKDRL